MARGYDVTREKDLGGEGSGVTRGGGDFGTRVAKSLRKWGSFLSEILVDGIFTTFL